MRVVREVAHPQFKITIYAWNNRYLIKLEQGLLEQTYKIDQLDVTGDEDVLAVLDETFLQEASDRFLAMSQSLLSARHRAER